jgi:HAD superfamily hydrolase (TIGR01450 family)
VTWVLDLDGVIWLGGDPVPGAADAVARLRDSGEHVLFATNNSFATRAEYETRLAEEGIPAEGDVVTSAMAAATFVEAGQRVLVCGGPGIVEALEHRGAEVFTAAGYTAGHAGWDAGIDVVMAGFHRDFDYERLRFAAQAVMGGARLVATNDDATYPTPQGPIPGGGAIVAAIAYAAGVEPVVAGKPHAPMADLIRSLAGRRQESPGRESPGRGPPGIVVGDRPETDGALAVALGYSYGLVLSGVTSADDLPVDPRPDLMAADLAGLVEVWSSRDVTRGRGPAPPV